MRSICNWSNEKFESSVCVLFHNCFGWESLHMFNYYVTWRVCDYVCMFVYGVLLGGEA